MWYWLFLCLLWKQRGISEPLDEGEKESGKAGLQLNIQNMGIQSITSLQKAETMTDFLSWAPKSLQLVTAALKFLEKKPMTNLDSVL